MTLDVGESGAHSLLFLSCDIVDSTRIKQKNSDWRAAFLNFYFGFPQYLKNAKGENNEIDFSLWKPVGDELIFTVKVTHERHVSDAVRIWLAAMDACDRSLGASDSFDVKGGAFIATFPSPDSESSIPRYPIEEISFENVYDANAKALKLKHSPEGYRSYMYDYFGPSIDTGFRIFSKSSQRFFTISIEVAWALANCESKENDGWDVCFLGEEILKGVWNNRPYPLFAIDTQNRDEINQSLSAISRTKATPAQVLKVAEACLKAEKWPSDLYLPDSKEPLVLEPPKPAPTEISMYLDGIEVQPSGDERGVLLEDSPPLELS